MNRVQSRYQVSTVTVRKQKVYSKTDVVKSKLVLKLLMLGGLMALLCLFWTWSRVQILQMSYEINLLSEQQRELKEQQKNYALELAVMQGPNHLEKIAEDSLGMTLPSLEQVIDGVTSMENSQSNIP